MTMVKWNRCFELIKLSVIFWVFQFRISFMSFVTKVERFRVHRSGLKKNQTARIKGIVSSSGYRPVSPNGV